MELFFSKTYLSHHLVTCSVMIGDGWCNQQPTSFTHFFLNVSQTVVIVTCSNVFVIFRDTRNMLSKMSFFVRPKSPISSKISSKFLIFVQI